jgi:hypothetical protein
MLAVEQAWAVEVTHWTASSGPNNNQHLVDSHSIPQRKFFTTNPIPTSKQQKLLFIHSFQYSNQEILRKRNFLSIHIVDV